MPTMHKPAPHHTRACSGCETSSRRSFLADLSARIGGTLVAIGVLPELAGALTYGVVAPEAVSPAPAAGNGASPVVSYDIPATDGATIDPDAEVILVRADGNLYAFALSCPHQNTALRWIAKDARFQCSKHKSRYRADGTFISGRATRSMDRFALRKEGNRLVVEVSTLLKQDEQAAQWAAAVVRV